MNVVEINLYNYGSVGKIMLDISACLRSDGHRVLVCFPATGGNLKREVPDSYRICTRVERNIGMILSKWTGCEDLFFRLPTRRLIRKMERFGVDAVHIHCLLGWYINFPMLFRYLRRKGIPVVWTLHDCWPLTGHCTHFDGIGCGKWKSDCRDCPVYRGFPESRVDNAARLLRLKRKYIAGMPALTLVSPSEWLADLAGQSYLKDAYVRVIHNGIDAEVYRPTESDFRSRRGLEGKRILLGVAMAWGRPKGLDVFVRLAGELDDRFAIILVGTSDEVDKGLPERIISIHQTMDRKELAAIYTAADLFVNPTRQENFPTVNIEALACGTPVLTYRTGGSPEVVDPTCGSVVGKDDYDALKAEILRITEERPFSGASCRERALQLTREKMCADYERLLRELVQ